MKRTFTVILAALMAVPGGLSARTATGATGGSRIYDGRALKGNNFCMWLTNYGMFGHNPQTDGSGAWWPCTRPLETYIFGAGIWVGAKKGSDTLVTFGYNPNSGESEMVPAHWGADSLDYATAAGDPYDRVHIYGVTTAEGYSWPLKASDGTDSIVSFTDAVMRFVDLDAASQEPGSAPIGLFFQQYAYTWTIAGLDNIVFLGYQIQNVSGDTLDSVYVAFTYDDDLGNEAGQNANDLVGFIRFYTFPGDTAPTLLNLAYQYQTEPEAGWRGPKGDGVPGVIGSMLLKTPTADPEYGDIIIHDSIGTQVSDTVHPGEELGMTAFKIFTLQIDPANDKERYTLMVGWDPPTAGGGWNPYMDDIYGPGDKRFMQVSGPFRMVPGEVVEFIGAAFVASDTASLLNTAKATLGIYKNNFASARPPQTPHLTAIPGFQKVTLYWDDVAESSRDDFYDIASDPTSDFYNPAYREFDFEGYRLLRSLDGEHWDTLGMWDLANGFTVFYIDTFVNGAGNEVYGDTLVVGSDNGLLHFFVDSGLTNGVRYFYRLEAYDLNWQTYAIDTSTGDTIGVRPFSLVAAASALGPDSQLGVVPRTPPANFRFSEGTYAATDRVRDWFSFDLIQPVDTGALDTTEEYIALLEYFGPVSTSGDAPTDFRLSFYRVKNNTWTPFLLHQPLSWLDYGTRWMGYAPGLLEFKTPDGTPVYAIQGLKMSVNVVPASMAYYVVDPALRASDDTTVGTQDGKWKFFQLVRVPEDTTKPLTGYGVTLNNRGVYYPSAVYKLTWHVQGDTARLTVEDTVRGITVPLDSAGVTSSSNSLGWAIYHSNHSPKHRDYLSISTDMTPDTTPRGGLIFHTVGVLLPGGNLLTLKWYYRNAQGDAVLLGPPQDGEVWYVSTYNEGTYDDLPVGVGTFVTETDSSGNTLSYYLTGDTLRFSFTPFQTNADYQLNVGVWPNPYRGISPLDYNKEFRLGGVHFTHLPENATIRIFNLAGDLVKVIRVKPQDFGEVSWDLLNEYGVRVASGIYIFHVETPEGKTFTGKFAVIL